MALTDYFFLAALFLPVTAVVVGGISLLLPSSPRNAHRAVEVSAHV